MKTGFIETRNLRLMPSVRASGVSYRISLPRPWVAELGLDVDNREVVVSFDGETISISAAKGGA